MDLLIQYPGIREIWGRGDQDQQNAGCSSPNLLRSGSLVFSLDDKGQGDEEFLEELVISGWHSAEEDREGGKHRLVDRFPSLRGLK